MTCIVRFFGLSVLHASVWVRDLCAEGVEPHPGPRRYVHPWCLTVLTLNVADKEGAWEVLNCTSEHRPAVAALQEVSLAPADVAAFRCKAHELGYHFFFSGAVATQKGMGGGAAVLVDRRLPARSLQAHSSHLGAFQLVLVGGSVVGSVYVAHTMDTMEMLEEVCSLLLLHSKARTITVAGDWNMLPSENPLVDACESAQLQVHTRQGLPTRWKGKRCIDYFLSNATVLPFELIEAYISDHMPWLLRMVDDTPREPVWKVRKTRRLLRPVEVPDQEWQKQLDDEWDSYKPEGVVDFAAADVDSVWDALSSALERCVEAVLDRHLIKRRIPIPRGGRWLKKNSPVSLAR